MKRISFALGYYHVFVWCSIWATMNAVNAAGANIYRNAICDYYGVSAAPLLDAATYGGWIGAFTFLIMPKLLEKFGAKNVMLTALTAGGIVFALIPATGNIHIMQLGIILTGIFAGIYGISTPMIMVSRWFPRSKGRVMGIVSSGVILSTVFMIPLLSWFIGTFGVVKGMACYGLGLVVFGILNLFILKDSPEECGLLPDNREMTEEERTRFSTKLVPEITMKDAARYPRLWAMSFGWGFNLLAMIGFTFIAVSYMLERGVPQSTVIMVVGISGVLSCFGSLICGNIDQKYGPVKCAVITFITQMSGMLIVIFYRGDSIAITVTGYLLTQLMTGASNSLASSQNLSAFGTRDYSVTFNFQTALTTVIKMFGTFFAARSLEYTGGYDLAYRLFGVALILSITLIVAAGDKPASKKGSDTL